MKRILFLLALFTVITFSVQAQNRGINRDTLNASETVYYYPNDAATDTLAKAYNSRGNLYIQMRSDSLSGATAVVNDIQYACGTDRNGLYDWVTQASGTLTSNGATSQTLIFEDIVFGATKWRIRSVVASGTAQATKITTSWDFKQE